MNKIFNFKDLNLLKLVNPSFQTLKSFVIGDNLLKPQTFKFYGIENIKKFFQTKFQEYNFETQEWVELNSLSQNEKYLNSYISGPSDLFFLEGSVTNAEEIQKIRGITFEDQYDVNCVLEGSLFLNEFINTINKSPLVSNFESFDSKKIKIKDNKYLFIIDNFNNTLKIFNIENIHNPYLIIELNDSNGQIISFEIKDNYLFLIIKNENEIEKNGLRIYDISNINNFEEITFFSFEEFISLPFIGIKDNLVIVSGKKSNLNFIAILDISDFQNISEVYSSSINQEEIINYTFNSKFIFLFLKESNSIRIYDIENQELNFISLPVFANYITGGFVFNENYLFINKWRTPAKFNGFSILNIEDLNNIQNLFSEDFGEENSFNFSNWPFLPIQIRMVEKNNKKYLVCLNGNKNILIYDITDLNNISFINSFKVNGYSYDFDFIFSGEEIYLAVLNLYGGISIYYFDINETEKFINEIENSPKWINGSFAFSNFKISKIESSPTTLSIYNYFSKQEDTVILNSNKTTLYFIETLEPVDLKENYRINKIFFDYAIENKTENNFIGIRLVDELSREWMYSLKNREWEYVGQPGGEFSEDTTFYQDFETINKYIGLFDKAIQLKFKIKIISDNNNVKLYRLVIDYDLKNSAQNKIILKGKIVDVYGNPIKDIDVAVAPQVPQSVLSGGVNSILGDNNYLTKTDENGDFNFELLAFTKIYIIIPKAGIRKLIYIEDSDINLGIIKL